MRKAAVALFVAVMLVASGCAAGHTTTTARSAAGCRVSRTCPSNRRASGVPLLPPRQVDFSTVNADHPVAGRIFEGLTIVNRSGLIGPPARFTSVNCDAEIGNHRLPARKLVYGVPKRGDLQVIVCGWRIPTGTAGKTLRSWKYRAFGGWRGPVVHLAPNGATIGGSLGAWRIRR